MLEDDILDLDFIQLPPAGTAESEMIPELEEVAQIISAIVGDQQPGRAPAGKKSPKRGESAQHSPRNKPAKVAQPDPLAEFVACPRCSYFMIGYRIRQGQENLQSAVQQIESGWLRLNWNLATRLLLQDAYGWRLDSDFYHYESCCSECLRIFSYREAKEGESLNQLWVQIKRTS